jgi:hypothetical protein
MPMKRNKPLTRKKPLRRASKKRAGELKVYRSLKNYILSRHPYCEMPSRTGAPSCLNKATQIHHVRGRSDNLLCDITWWMAVCEDCHAYIHEHAKESRKRGLLKF